MKEGVGEESSTLLAVCSVLLPGEAGTGTEVLTGANTDPHVAANKGPIEKGQGGRAVVRVEEHDSSLLRPGNL